VLMRSAMIQSSLIFWFSRPSLAVLFICDQFLGPDQTLFHPPPFIDLLYFIAIREKYLTNFFIYIEEAKSTNYMERNCRMANKLTTHLVKTYISY